MSTNKITGSHLIAKSLEKQGVKNIFTLAGDHVLPTLDVISEQNFKIWDTRHEQAAVHMADAWGRITGQLGVSIYTTPGLSNAIPGLANAIHSESPLLSISGSAELEELGRGAMQEIDQVGMAKPITKGSWMVTDPKRIPDMIGHAIRVAYSGRRGPVHLTIPVDIQQMEVPEYSNYEFANKEIQLLDTALANDSQINNIINLMKSAKNPLIILGSPCSYTDTPENFTDLIETIKFPVMTEGDARGIIPDSHEYSCGFFDNGLNSAAKKIRETDLLILLGRKQDLIIGYAMNPIVPSSAKIIQIDPNASVIGRNRRVDVGIVGNISQIVNQITLAARNHKWDKLEWLEELKQAQQNQLSDLQTKSQNKNPMHASFVHKIASEIISDDDILVFDGGDFCHFGRAFHQSNTLKSWWYLPTSGMLGQAIPTALAAKIAHPNRRVFMFTGDGAFGFNGFEYDTAVRHNLNIIGIMGNDSTWGIDKHIQEKVFGKSVATKLLPSRYDQVVSGLGGYSELVTDHRDLKNAISRSVNQDLPSLLNVQISNSISPRAEAAITKWKSHTPEPM
jgi:acetolactate synthase-1/2/3 large subunit